MALPRSIRHPLRRFAQLSLRHRALVIEAVACLAAARLGLVALPFPRLARHLGAAMTPREARALAVSIPASPQAVRIAEDVGWAVTRAARYLPFRAVCLPQAMAARMMLARRGVASMLHFGAATDGDGRVIAHAWLDATGVEVTGYPVPPAFAEVACFV
jgi:hypothetical protein